jgi:hypothetical protein
MRAKHQDNQQHDETMLMIHLVMMTLAMKPKLLRLNMWF